MRFDILRKVYCEWFYLVLDVCVEMAAAPPYVCVEIVAGPRFPFPYDTGQHRRHRQDKQGAKASAHE
jgi:hypothetical protein